MVETHKATVRWGGKRQFIAWDEAGHGIVMDSKREWKGEGSGPTPVGLLLYALAGCTGMDVVSILEKQRQDVRGLEIEVHAERREEHPKIFTRIVVEYVVTGVGISESQVARAIELSEGKYCSVRHMFGPDTRVETAYRIQEPGAPGPAE